MSTIYWLYTYTTRFIRVFSLYLNCRTLYCSTVLGLYTIKRQMYNAYLTAENELMKMYIHLSRNKVKNSWVVHCVGGYINSNSINTLRPIIPTYKVKSVNYIDKHSECLCHCATVNVNLNWCHIVYVTFKIPLHTVKTSRPERIA